MDHTTDPLICTLVDAATDAEIALDNAADEAEAAGDLQASQFIRRRADALGLAIAGLEMRRIEALSPEELGAELAQLGITPEDIDAGAREVDVMLRAHREASKRRAKSKCDTMADRDLGDADDVPFPDQASATDLARFNLEMVDVYIGDLWRAVFGPDEPMPNSGTTRLQALSRIMGMCLNVEWPWRKHRRPSLRVLPVGIEPDNGD